MMGVVFSGRFPAGLKARRIERLVGDVGRRVHLPSQASVGLRFVSLKEIQSLNRRYRRKDRPTDVLAFPSSTMPSSKQEDVGDIILAPAYARHEAQRRAIPFEEELMRLIIHGLLHLAGYDHATERQEQRMFALQEKLLARYL